MTDFCPWGSDVVCNGGITSIFWVPYPGAADIEIFGDRRTRAWINDCRTVGEFVGDIVLNLDVLRTRH